MFYRRVTMDSRWVWAKAAIFFKSLPNARHWKRSSPFKSRTLKNWITRIPSLLRSKYALHCTFYTTLHSPFLWYCLNCAGCTPKLPQVTPKVIAPSTQRCMLEVMSHSSGRCAAWTTYEKHSVKTWKCSPTCNDKRSLFVCLLLNSFLNFGITRCCFLRSLHRWVNQWLMAESLSRRVVCSVLLYIP